ncbi:hypothetical protein [Sphingosinicella terrae]|jgi:hypothetical protein|uniref:hypothetical protein n=1 Tax=Sphingosinicella terrae TaxID=2172047 RepID=UPI000E0CED5C|nr:hypothetical protein [Sphingosinicella terrae]
MKVLNILSTGYRATLEEQDDTVLWISQAMKRAGAELDLLLRASTVNYVVEGQRVVPLSIGARSQRNAPDVHAQLRDLAGGGATIFLLREDLELYGLLDRPRLGEVRLIGAGGLPGLLSAYDQVWHW